MKNLTPLQIILSGVFIIAILAATLIFAGVLPGLKDKGPSGASQINYWDTIPQPQIRVIADTFSKRFGASIKYREIEESKYLETIIDALASGNGPDVWRIPNDVLLKNIQKARFTMTTVYPERTFREKYLDEASLLIFPQGIVGFPANIDPLVLYWNKTLFRGASISGAPKTWAQFITASEKLTRMDSSKNIIQAGAALGDFSNVDHAKDILSLLIMQSGNPLARLVTQGTGQNIKVKFDSALDEIGQEALPAVESSLRFFNDFSDPRKSSYSWAGSLPDSIDYFIQGKLAMYIGYGSEYKTIKEKNPHLDFDITEIPQISQDTPDKMTFGRMSVYIISRQSTQAEQTTALRFIDFMSTPEVQSILISDTPKAPVLRSSLAKLPDDPILSIIYNSVIKSVSWLEPGPQETYNIFKDMTRSIATGRKDARKAINDANQILQNLFDSLLIK